MNMDGAGGNVVVNFTSIIMKSEEHFGYIYSNVETTHSQGISVYVCMCPDAGAQLFTACLCYNSKENAIKNML